MKVEINKNRYDWSLIIDPQRRWGVRFKISLGFLYKLDIQIGLFSEGGQLQGYGLER